MFKRMVLFFTGKRLKKNTEFVEIKIPDECCGYCALGTTPCLSKLPDDHPLKAKIPDSENMITID